MIEIRLASERGTANFGWLDSRHSFSFGSYYDPAHMGYSALRVINDDTVEAGAGFSAHGHKNMEIISYVLEGAMEHKDSMGNVQRLPAGEFQLMSAGSGLTHSEYNASKTELLKFLQIWVVPDEQNGDPGYQQKRFSTEPGLLPIITPNGENGTLKIKQQASLSQLILEPSSEQIIAINPAAKTYVHQVAGELSINGQPLKPGDGAKITDLSKLELKNEGGEQLTALIFDLPG